MKTSVRILSKSHIIVPSAIVLLERLDTNVQIELIDKATFFLHWQVDEDSDLFSEHHDFHCSLVFSAMLAAINIASLGLFTWQDGTSCLLYTSPSPRDATLSRMPSSA